MKKRKRGKKKERLSGDQDIRAKDIKKSGYQEQ
jgi:hypothetical protein